MARRDVGVPIDANGNLTSDGTRTFEWDARNQLVAVTVGTHRTEFDYNGEQRRVRIVEKENGTIQAERRFLWCATTVCEERDAAGATTVVRFFDRGEQRASPLFVTRDHLDSIREATQSDGVLAGRYDYAPWGEMTLASGTAVTDRGYTNHFMNAASGVSKGPTIGPSPAAAAAPMGRRRCTSAA